MVRSRELWALVVILAVLVIVPPAVLAQWGLVQKGMEATRQSPQPQTQSPAGDGHPQCRQREGGRRRIALHHHLQRLGQALLLYPSGGLKGSHRRERPVHAARHHGGLHLPSDPDGADFSQEGLRRCQLPAGLGGKKHRQIPSVKRRDQGKVIGWETNETPDKCSGDFQRIQWQCYDGQKYYYTFIAHADPCQFQQHRVAPSLKLPPPTP
jgi:hypothetical protein